MKNKEKNGTFLVFTICFVILLVPEIVNGWCGTCGNTPQTTYDSCGEPVTHTCYYNNPLCRAEDCGPWPLSGSIYRSGETCYYNFESTACGGGTGGGGCTPGTCSDCTLPSCPSVNGDNSDYTTTKPVDAEGTTIDSPLAACIGNSISCKGWNGCANCNPKGPNSCYLPETNLTAIPTPTWNRLKIGVLTSGNLSTNSASRTLVHFPLPGVAISSLTNTITNPTGSRELRYNFLIDATAPAIAQTSNELLGKPLLANLTQGYEGSIRTNYQTLNKCNDSVRSGSTLTTYYKVNTLPVVTSLTISGESGDNITTRGCTATASYTGKEVNNPLIVTIKGTDANDTNSINGAYLWMVKEGTTIPAGYLDKRYSVGPGQTDTKPEIIGLFLAHSSTSDSVSIYKSINDNSTGTLSGWGRDTHDGTSGGIPNMDVMDRDLANPANNKMLIQDFEILQHEVIGGEFTFKIKLPFPTDSLGPISGNYKFYAGMTDNLSYYSIPGAGTYVELRTNQLKTQPSWQWNFDFLNPTITTPTAVPDPGDQRKIQLNWGSNGTGSNVQNTVVNVYKTLDPIYAVTKLLPTPVADINIIKPEDVLPDSIGLISPSITSGWQFVDQTTTKFNINNNSNGVLSEYVTIYDQACNFSSTGGATSFPSTDLDRWIATKGGVFYSDGRIGYIPKEKIGEKYNLGTELITTKYSNHPGTKDWGDFMNPVTVINAMDPHDLENGYKFDFLVTKFEEMKEKVAFGIVTDDNLNCNNPSGCVLYLTTDKTLGKTDDTTQTYSGKILVYTIENITVGPNLVAQNPAVDGLILLAAKNITVHSTKHSSTVGVVHYDRIDALMISKDQINIPDGLGADLGVQQDGVLINGSLLAFGETQNPSIYLKRNLGLLNISNPVLIVNYHPKYAKLSELFFGTDTTTYKQEVGFKF